MRGVDVVTIQKAMGHSALATTSRYLHARPASEQAQAFTAAFMPDVRSDATVEAVFNLTAGPPAQQMPLVAPRPTIL